jgi:glycosyltransferase involved in cell wall biosynthesis
MTDKGIVTANLLNELILNLDKMTIGEDIFLGLEEFSLGLPAASREIDLCWGFAKSEPSTTALASHEVTIGKGVTRNSTGDLDSVQYDFTSLDLTTLLPSAITLKNIYAFGSIYMTPNATVGNPPDLESALVKGVSGGVNLFMTNDLNLEAIFNMMQVEEVPAAEKPESNSLENKASERILIYAGAILEKYGIKKLIDAFRLLGGNDLRLHIYGAGAMEKDMPGYMSLDNRIVYHGTVPNQEIVQNELKATLLVNPRPSNEEFTKYSFPSKNMEYMVSGTPLVTSLLPGMPLEYNQFVYIFDDESVEGICRTLKFLLSKPGENLHEFGNHAKQFVLDYKNNFIQAERLLLFFEKV